MKIEVSQEKPGKAWRINNEQGLLGYMVLYGVDYKDDDVLDAMLSKTVRRRK